MPDRPVPARRRTLAYGSVLLGCSLAAAPRAEAAIVTIDLTNCGTNNQNITGVNAGMTYGQSKRTILGFVAGGGLDIYFSSGDIGFDADDGGSGLLFRFATNDLVASPKNFASGSVIDGPNAARWTASASQTQFRLSGSVSADFGPGSFMGFRFSTNNGVDWNYGYIEVLFTDTGTDSTSSFRLLSAAYESNVNTAIVAGATGGVVPLPGAAGLAACGLLGLSRRRRR